MSVQERINVLERETVRVLTKKLNGMDAGRPLAGSDSEAPGGQGAGSIVEIMTDDKNRLEEQIRKLEQELAEARRGREEDGAAKDAHLLRMQRDLLG